MRVLAGDRPGPPLPVIWPALAPGLAWLLAGLLAFGGASALLAVRRQR
jgi:ABC-2 type transport system permease protein